VVRDERSGTNEKARDFVIEISHRMHNQLYDEIMSKGWNEKLEVFTQSYETREKGVLDSSVLIMPLVFFIRCVSAIYRTGEIV
jgi:GH15 family glucan-1,4-alpha-glucosidase